MNRTVVGFFASASEAQSVRNALVSEAIPLGNMRVLADEDPRSTTATSSAAADEGIGAKISNFFRSLTGSDEDAHHYTQGVSQGGTLLSVTVPEEQQERVISLLESHGARNVEDQDLGQSSSRLANPVGTSAANVQDTAAIPVVQEELQVGKREVQRGGIRVYSHMVETPVQENVVLREEHVHMDRRPVDRAATDADFAAFKEGSIELTETAEEAVVSKRARVVEEVVVGKESSERTQTVKDSVRHTEVEIEQLGTESGAAANAAGATAGGTLNRQKP